MAWWKDRVAVKSLKREWKGACFWCSQKQQYREESQERMESHVLDEMSQQVVSLPEESQERMESMFFVLSVSYTASVPKSLKREWKAKACRLALRGEALFD